MAVHEEFLELCAAATAGELSAAEQAKLDAHLAVCADCRRAMEGYDLVARCAAAAFASEMSPGETEVEGFWSVAKAEKELFRRIEEGKRSAAEEQSRSVKQGQRFTYRPSEIRWFEVSTPFAAAILLALALGIAAYRTGVKRGTEVAQTQTTAEPAEDSQTMLEEQVSDAGHERVLLLAKIADQDRTIAELRRRLSEQQRAVSALMEAEHRGGSQPAPVDPKAMQRDQELAAAEAKLAELQTTIETLTAQRDEGTSRAARLEARVDELTQLAKDRERELDLKQEEVARQQDLLEHDRDIRELMGARDLYIAEVHDVAGNGQTDKTYGRVFYTRGKRLVFYAYDLDAHTGVRNASTFQAWGRRGPDKQQARNLGIFYEDNVSKKRWVLKASDPKTLEDIDAVFVTVEPNGGSSHPSGRQLLFAYLRVNPNHP